MAGNLLGARKYYAYTLDDGTSQYKYLTDENLGEAVGAVENDALQDLPRRFEPRGVYAEDDDGNRKFVICPTVGNATYVATSSTTITIDGTAFKTTGRRGERQSFGRNPAGAGG